MNPFFFLALGAIFCALAVGTQNTRWSLRDPIMYIGLGVLIFAALVEFSQGAL